MHNTICHLASALNPLHTKENPQPKRSASTTKRMRTLAGLGLATLLALQTSCGRPKPLIYVIPRTTATLFWESMHSGALETARKAGYRIYWNAATREDDVSRQLTLLQQAQKRAPAGIVFAPSHGPALLTEVRNLIASGLPVVIVESRFPLPNGPNFTYIATDHERSGRELARRVEVLEKSPRVAIVGLDPDISAHMEILRGFVDELAQSTTAELVSKQFSRFNRQQTEEQLEGLLKANPDINAVLSLDPASTAGALDAIRRHQEKRKIHLFGCDQDLFQIEPLRSGELDGVMVQDTFREGQLAVQAIIEHHQSGHWPAEISVPARLVSGRDLEDPEVKRIFSLLPRSGR